MVFIFFLRTNFEVLALLSSHLYVICIILLILPLIIGEVTRGVIRWIPLGPFSFQPSEVVRPFLILFLAYLTANFKKIKILPYLFYLGLPIGLIVIQPSLGVAILTSVSFVGVIVASSIEKKKLVFLGLGFLSLLPLLWLMLAPYQKARIVGFLNPYNDPHGGGYNSIQSMIAVGSGELWGRGIGKGFQTQLDFLPEKHTDFIFAAIGEEMGFVGVLIVFVAYTVLFLRIIKAIEYAKDYKMRLFASGVFLSLLFETCVHIGMNVGLLPITGVTLPLLSGGGSSFLATMIMLGMVASGSSRNSS